MIGDISKEPLQNRVAADVGLQKAWRMLATDLLGNRLLLDSLSWLCSVFLFLL